MGLLTRIFGEKKPKFRETSRNEHGIKHPEIVHFIDNGRYLCIGSCYPTPSKSTVLLSKVTCRNCKRILGVI
jgi:hypothetical protein